MALLGGAVATGATAGKPGSCRRTSLAVDGPARACPMRSHGDPMGSGSARRGRLAKGERIRCLEWTNAALRNIVRRDPPGGGCWRRPRRAASRAAEEARLDRKARARSSRGLGLEGDPEAKIPRSPARAIWPFKIEHAVASGHRWWPPSVHEADEARHDVAGDRWRATRRISSRARHRRPKTSALVMCDRQGLVGLARTRISEPKQMVLRAGTATGRPAGPQPDPAVIGRGLGSLQAARRDRRALLCALPTRTASPDMLRVTSDPRPSIDA